MVILAGGLGTRIASVTEAAAIPKALIPLNGEPFIDHKLRELRDRGVSEVWLLVGHRAAALEEHLGDGRDHGLRVRFVHDGPRLLGTGGALRQAAAVLPDRFWLTYGDTLLDVPLAEVERSMGAGDLAVMTVLRNADRWEPSNVAVDERQRRVAAYRKGAPTGSFEFIDYGMLLVRRDLFALAADLDDPFDLGVVWQRCIDAGRLGAFEVTERFHEIGTPDALAETEAWLAAGR